MWQRCFTHAGPGPSWRSPEGSAERGRGVRGQGGAQHARRQTACKHEHAGAHQRERRHRCRCPRQDAEHGEEAERREAADQREDWEAQADRNS